MKEYLEESGTVLKELNTKRTGLYVEEAEARLEADGKNQLEEAKKIPLWRRFLSQLADPMIIILAAAAAVSGITAVYAGDSFADVIIILTVVLINAALGVAQESKAEKAIAALQEIAPATSKVIRGGRQKTVRSEQVVRGDIIVLEAGDAVPADGRILECAGMKVEEAALTGESVPVLKTEKVLTAEEGKRDITLGDRRNMVYMGSTVAYGRGTAVVTGAGMNTEMGKIADALTQAKNSETPLQVKLSQLSRVLSALVLGICIMIFAMGLFRAYPQISGQKIIDTFMVAVSLAVAAIPEGLAAVVTIVLSLGVTNMSKKNAIIRKMTAVETLGCTQIICSDKTGTLTQNRMTVTEHTGTDEAALAASLALCSDAYLNEKKEAEGEPTETALVSYAWSVGEDQSRLKKEYVRIAEAPFDPVRKMMSTVHRKPDGAIVQFTKGAPDEVVKRCTHILTNGQTVPLCEEERARILKENKFLADRALRVLAAAKREYKARPTVYDAVKLEQDLCFLGLVGMIDPVRPEVKPAIEECRRAGIRPIMITGDHKDTAVAIAMQLGIIESPTQAITGAELDNISDEDFEREIGNYSVYARVQPEHKVRIVTGWKKKGCVTAMTGDGVNDAPSIKTADIGIGMGITGTDVTKNVADMVLADDNFATIVTAVEEGRRIYDNIRKSIQFLLSSNLSEVLAIFAATLMGFVILKPVHLLWINVITDCFPAIALGMERPEKNVMSRPPRNPEDGIFSGGVGFNAVVQGIAIAVITLASYLIGHYIEGGIWEVTNSADGTTMAFLTLSMTEIFHSFNMRSLHKSVFSMDCRNKWLWLSMAASMLCTTAVIYVPFLSAAFGFEHISAVEYGAAILLAACIIPFVEIIKWKQKKGAGFHTELAAIAKNGLFGAIK